MKLSFTRSVLPNQLFHLVNVRIMPFYAVRKGRAPGIYNTWYEIHKFAQSG